MSEAKHTGLLALAAAVVLACAWTPPARADDDSEDDKDTPHDRVVIDRVEVTPSVLPGRARVRVLVSSTRLRGGRISVPASKLDVKVSGAKPAVLGGYFATADVEMSLVILVPTTVEFEDELESIKEQLTTELLEPLKALGPRIRIQIVGYGDSLTGSKSVGSLDAARKALGMLESDGSTDPPDLVDLVGRAVKTASAGVRSPRNKGALGRGAVVLIASGVTITDENADVKAKLTTLGEAAAKAGVRIHTIGAIPGPEPRPRRPLLALGELSKRSQGTFRWVPTANGWSSPFRQLAEQIALQYVVTFFAPPDELAGKKLTVAVPTGSSRVEAEPAKLGEPKCGKEVCEGNAYCVNQECVPRRLDSGRSVIAWILLVGGVAAGALIVLLGVVALIMRARRPRPPAPFPAAAGGPAPALGGMPAPPGAVAAAPPMVAPVAVAGPVLIVLTGPAAGARLPLRHGFLAGKAPGSDLDLSHDGYASTNHAQIAFEGGAWVVYDRGSTNGTFSNGVRITQVRLDHGMTIRFGSTDVRYWQQ